MKVAPRIGQWVLALLFAMAAGLKLAWMTGRGGGGGAQTMFGALPGWVQWGLVVVELGLALWLASGWRPRLGSLVTIGLLSIFLAAVLVEMGKPAPRDCGCMGNLMPAGGSLGWALGLDGFMLGLAVGVYYASLWGVKSVTKNGEV